MGNTHNNNIYKENRIISIGDGITFTQFMELFKTSVKYIPTDVINIIADYTAIYNVEGILLSEFSICPERPLSIQNHTAYCTVSPSGVVFVSDSSSREIRRFDYSGQVLPSFHKIPLTYYKVDNSNFITVPCHYTGPLSIYNIPYNITLDRDENLYITDYYNNIVIKYHKSGELASPKSIIGIGKNITHPLGITMDKDKELLYVSSDCKCNKNSELSEIKSFTPEGYLVQTFHVPNTALNLSIYKNDIMKLYRSETINYITLFFYIISLPISNSSQIPINEIGNLYVADTVNNSVGVFKADNLSYVKTVKLYDSKGKSIKPTTIALDEQGHLIVVSCTENKVFIYR
jgi:sugar lactone lactonase YvrE